MGNDAQILTNRLNLIGNSGMANLGVVDSVIIFYLRKLKVDSRDSI